MPKSEPMVAAPVARFPPMRLITSIVSLPSARAGILLAARTRGRRLYPLDNPLNGSVAVGLFGSQLGSGLPNPDAQLSAARSDSRFGEATNLMFALPIR